MSNQHLRKRLYRILQPARHGDRLSRWFDRALILLIIANVAAVMLETVSSFKAQWHQALLIFEIVSVIIFTAEYIARVWTAIDAPAFSSPEQPKWQRRLRYMRSPMAIIDLLAVLPCYLQFFFAVDLRMLRLFRLLRIIKIGRYSRSVHMLVTVLRKEARVLIAAMSVLMIIMIMAATGMHYIEHEAQPEAFGSIPMALWWALNTLTTVGYGDVTPVTALGKLFSGVITLLGVAIFALPAGILASSLTEQLRIRRDTFRKYVLEAINDGDLTPQELTKLQKLRDTLDLDDKQASLVISLMRDQMAKKNPHSNQSPESPTVCPHCQKSLISEPIDEHQAT